MTGIEFLRERGVNVDKEEWSEDDFHRVGLPMAINCNGCNATVAFPFVSEAILVEERPEDAWEFYCSSCVNNGYSSSTSGRS